MDEKCVEDQINQHVTYSKDGGALTDIEDGRSGSVEGTLARRSLQEDVLTTKENKYEVTSHAQRYLMATRMPGWPSLGSREA